MNRKKVKLFFNTYGCYFVGLSIIIIFAAILKQFFYYKEIKENKKETIGHIVNFSYSSRGTYTLYYEYSVDGNIHSNSIGTSAFYGYNKRKGCVGCSFKVYYSSKDPSKSSLRLGEYEKYKTTVEFGQFEK